MTDPEFVQGRGQHRMFMVYPLDASMCTIKLTTIAKNMSQTGNIGLPLQLLQRIQREDHELHGPSLWIRRWQRLRCMSTDVRMHIPCDDDILDYSINT